MTDQLPGHLLSAKPGEEKITETWRSLLGQLQQVRRQRRISQIKLSGVLNLMVLEGKAAPALTAWETGKDLPALGNLINWAEALGLTLVIREPGRVASPLVPERNESAARFQCRKLVRPLVEARVGREWTQEMVGKQVGASAWSVHMWERGLRNPRLMKLLKWCQLLECEVVLMPHHQGTGTTTVR